jgi:energy-coupling factor transport system ATP-binding protein
MRLEFRDVSFVYPSAVRALDGVDLAIESGQIVAIVGENGAGKTTLVKLLNGLLKPTQGTVMVGDWNTADKTTAELSSRVAFLFQNPDEQLFERTVEREVAFGPRNLGARGNAVRKRVRAALELVGLGDQAQAHPYDLPQTERKMLALAATIAMQSPVMVLDEPTIGQDADGRKRIARILQQLRKQGATLVLITHDVEFCAQNAQRVVVMADGHILADGPAQDVLVQSQLLKQAAVNAPQLVRLAQSLGMPAQALTVKDFVETYSQWRRKKKKA